MSQPENITALVQTQNGYNPEPEGHIRFDSFEPFIELREIGTPELAEHQVLIEMTMAAINPSDLHFLKGEYGHCLLYTSPSPRDRTRSRMPSSA